MIRIKPSIVNDNEIDNDNEEPITLVVDASGLTVSKKGEVIWKLKTSNTTLHLANNMHFYSLQHPNFIVLCS